MSLIIIYGKLEVASSPQKFNKCIHSMLYKIIYSNLFIFKIVHRVIRIHNKITLFPVLHQCSSFGEVSHLQRPLKAIPLKNKKIIHSLKPTLHVWSSSSGWNARATNCTCSRHLNSHAYKVTHSETNYHKHSFFLTYNKGMKICCLMTLSSC